jgi:hypothetical protein
VAGGLRVSVPNSAPNGSPWLFFRSRRGRLPARARCNSRLGWRSADSPFSRWRHNNCVRADQIPRWMRSLADSPDIRGERSTLFSYLWSNDRTCSLVSERWLDRASNRVHRSLATLLHAARARFTWRTISPRNSANRRP